MSEQRIRRRLIVLGSTGSIGVNTLAVVEHLRDACGVDFEVAGLAAGSNAAALSEQAKRFGVRHVAIADEAQARSMRGVEHPHVGRDAALDLIHAIARPGDLVMGAMVGAAGIPATLAAIERGCDIALANKETLVAAGELVMPRIRANGVRLLPVDSEHSAIFQCLLAGRSISEVKRLVLTASGGPFRTWSKERTDQATVEQALNHPTWKMGPKVTVDSASLMNKALEIIEAHWLFDLPAEKIDVIVHPQSLIHSFVEFADNSVLAQLGPPDMRTPIQYALTWPHRAGGCSRPMDWASLRSMDFEPVDRERFIAPGLAHEVIRAGGTAGAVFNAANEAAVAAFLANRVPFGRIGGLVADTLAAIPATSVHNMNDVLAADAAARAHVGRSIGEGVDEPTPSFATAKPSPSRV